MIKTSEERKWKKYNHEDFPEEDWDDNQEEEDYNNRKNDGNNRSGK